MVATRSGSGSTSAVSSATSVVTDPTGASAGSSSGGTGSGGDTTPPTTPGNVAITSVSQTVLGIGWQGSTDNVGVAGYEIFTNGVLDRKSTAVSAAFSELTCSTTYVIGIDAYDAAGNRSHLMTASDTTANCGSGSTGNSPSQAGNPVPPPANGAYFGAYIEGAQTFGHYYPSEGPWVNAPWDTRTWDRFESDAGKKVALEFFGRPVFWQDPFDYDHAFDDVAARGAIPVVDIGTGSTPLTDITKGVYDAQITARASAAASWGKPFVLRLDAEMNGTWYGYGAQARTNPQAFVAMWRHVHDLFVAAGATNVSWHWCPNVDQENNPDPARESVSGRCLRRLDGHDRVRPRWGVIRLDVRYDVRPARGSCAVEADHDRRDRRGRRLGRRRSRRKGEVHSGLLLGPSDEVPPGQGILLVQLVHPGEWPSLGLADRVLATGTGRVRSRCRVELQRRSNVGRHELEIGAGHIERAAPISCQCLSFCALRTAGDDHSRKSEAASRPTESTGSSQHSRHQGKIARGQNQRPTLTSLWQVQPSST